MALFLRGGVWWMEFRTRSVRRVISTGFRKDQKSKAQAAWDAMRLGMGARPKRSAMEGILDAIYDPVVAEEEGIALSSVSDIYDEWASGKGRVVAKNTEVCRRRLLACFAEWASQRGCHRVADVDVAIARAFLDECRRVGRPGAVERNKHKSARPLGNKSLRNVANTLSSVWSALSQLRTGVHNPWLAARPDNDGSSVRREAFSFEQERLVLAECQKVGHDWYLASMLARWTGQRYGDVAMFEWGDAEMAQKAATLACGVVDLDSRLIVLDPSKTRRHGLRLVLPMADALAEALSSIPGNKRRGWVIPEHAVKYEYGVEPPFSEVLRRAGLDTDKFTFHSWRHTFRTRLAEAGVKDDVAMRFGWTNLSMSKHYDHATHLSELRDAVDRLS